MMPNDVTMKVPGAGCAHYASLLPLATHGQLDETRLAAVLAHVGTCGHCQQEMALHERLDGALRRVMKSEDDAGAVLFSRAEIQRMRDRVEVVPTTGGASSASKRQARRVSSGLFIGIPAIAAVVLLALFAGFVFHLSGGRNGNRVGPSKPTPLPSNIDIASISMVSATEGWAVGGTRPDPNYSPIQDGTPTPNYRDPVLAHYHDGVWRLVALPAFVQQLSRNGLSIVLNSVSMVSADEGWAAGGSVLPPNADGMTIGVLLHYTHGRWIFALGGTSDTPVFSEVHMRSATDGWAVAGFVYRYDGSGWRRVSDAALKNISVWTLALAPDGGIWAQGFDYSGNSGFDGDASRGFLHFDGTHWSRVALPLPQAQIASIAMTSAGNGWAVGVLYPPSSNASSPNAMPPYAALILRYSNGGWEEQTRFPGPVGAGGRTFYTFNRIVATADGQGWAVGSNGLLAHYAHGAWERLPSVGTSTLFDITFVGPSEGWAVGEHGTVLHYVDGRWSAYPA